MLFIVHHLSFTHYVPYLSYTYLIVALAIMHVLSSFMGFALPALLPKLYTHYASVVLFLYFGYKLLSDAYESKGEGPSEELHVCIWECMCVYVKL